MRAQRTKSNTKRSGKMGNKRYHRSHLCERSIVRRMSNTKTTYGDIIRHRTGLESRIIRDIVVTTLAAPSKNVVVGCGAQPNLLHFSICKAR